MTYDPTTRVIAPKGGHCEECWRRAFGQVVRCECGGIFHVRCHDLHLEKATPSVTVEADLA
jgi:hypothetical protein